MLRTSTKRLLDSSIIIIKPINFINSGHNFSTKSITLSNNNSNWKGKGKEILSTIPIRVVGNKKKLINYQTIRSINGSSTSSSSSSTSIPNNNPDLIYAHEDLLSTTRSTNSSNSTSSDTALPFFENSFKQTLDPILPPPSTSPLVPLSSPIPIPHPKTVLSNGQPNPLIRWRPRPLTTISDDLSLYKTIAKARLSAFVVLTAMAGYAMCPVDPSSAQVAMEALANSLSAALPPGTSIESLQPLNPSSTSNSLALSVLLPATVGTLLCASSAATFNQLIEAPYDAQMARTRARPVPRRFMSPLHATTFGALTGTLGLGTLYAINPLSAAIGATTILLYCPIYTILKRHTVYNTWVGAIVGSLPPLIGWAACTDSLSPVTQPGAYALFFLLFFWQFPHFNSLAHTLRSSYASSGYRMLPVLNPAHNALVSLRYSAAILPLCATFPALGLTTSLFPWLALAPNGAMAVAAYRFWIKREDRRAKVLFWTSLVHLPLVLALAMLCKKGLWDSGEELEEYEEADLSGDYEVLDGGVSGVARV